MSDPSNNIFDDANANHPLDLLINAISGSGEYEIPPEAREGHGEFNLEQLLGNDSTGESSRVRLSLGLCSLQLTNEGEEKEEWLTDHGTGWENS
jgi:hypothetical protein